MSHPSNDKGQIQTRQSNTSGDTTRVKAEGSKNDRRNNSKNKRR